MEKIGNKKDGIIVDVNTILKCWDIKGSEMEND